MTPSNMAYSTNALDSTGRLLAERSCRSCFDYHKSQHPDPALCSSSSSVSRDGLLRWEACR